jgi:lysozyme
MTTEYLRDDLRFDEAIGGEPVLEVYPDPKSGAEPYTVGFGHTGPDVHLGDTWTSDECTAALDSDIGIATRALDEHLPWWRQHSDLRQDVLANMTFNMGVGKVEKFEKMIAALQRYDYETAANEMLDSQWAREDVGDDPPSPEWPVGQRAYRLSQQMRTGERATPI